MKKRRSRQPPSPSPSLRVCACTERWSLSISARICASTSSFCARCVRAVSSAACTFSISCGPGLRRVVWGGVGGASGAGEDTCLGENGSDTRSVSESGSCNAGPGLGLGLELGTMVGMRGDASSMLSSLTMSSSSGRGSKTQRRSYADTDTRAQG